MLIFGQAIEVPNLATSGGLISTSDDRIVIPVVGTNSTVLTVVPICGFVTAMTCKLLVVLHTFRYLRCECPGHH